MKKDGIQHRPCNVLADIEGIGELILDSKGYVKGVNEAAEGLLQTSRSHLLDKPFWELSGTPKIDRFKQLLTQAKQQGIVQEELSLSFLDGSGSQAMTVTLVFNTSQDDTTEAISFFFKPLDREDSRVKDLARKEARYRLALEFAGIGIWDMDIEKNETFRSPLHDAHFGYPTPLENWGYNDFISHVHADDRERIAKAYHDAMVGGEEYDASFRVVWPDGSIRWQWTKGRFYLNDAGKPVHVAGLTADITASQRIKEEMELARRSIDSSSEGICIVDARAPGMPMIQANPAFYRLTGYSESEVIGENCRILQGPDTDEGQLELLREAIREQRHATVLLKNYKKSGEPFWNELTIAPVKDDAGEIAHFVGLQRDVTQETRLKADLQFQAMHDDLTGLGKRKQFEADLTLLIDQTRPGHKVGVYFIDVDHFKRINDFWDHATGDLFLQEIARRLQSFSAPEGVPGRFGGDEFYLAMPNLESVEDVEHVASQLLTLLSAPVTLGDHQHQLSNTVSIGVSTFPNDGINSDNLITYADDALLQAKRNGRAVYVMFDEQRLAERLSEFSLETDLKKAIEKHELQPFYQAKFNSLTNELTGFEALIRWVPKDSRPISPGVFIPIAEQSGLIHEIGHLVINEVFRQIQFWRDQNYELVPVAINVSNLQLESGDLGEFILDRLQVFGIPGSLVEIELTETVGVYDTDRLIRFMGMLKPLGVTFAIDDFGTGHSNLCYLRQFPFDCLKIDKQFVAELTNMTDDAGICRAIVALADIFNMKVVGEGVEDQETADYLQKIGCFELQGFLYAKPVNAECATEHLQRRKLPESNSEPNPPAHKTPDEAARAHSIRRFELDKQHEMGALTTIVDLVRRSFNVEFARFNILFGDSKIQEAGSPSLGGTQAPEEVFFDHNSSIFAATIMGPGIYTVSDLATHPIHGHHPMVAVNRGLRFYAGVSVYAPDGKVIGALSLAGRKLRHLSGEEFVSLHKFANLIEESLFYIAVSKSLKVRRLWNERNYQIELPKKWRDAARKQQPFGVLSIGLENCPKNKLGLPAIADQIGSALSYLSEETGALPYRLQDDSFRLVFIGSTEDEIHAFWAALKDELSANVDEDFSSRVEKRIGFVQSASGSTTELGSFLRALAS